MNGELPQGWATARISDLCYVPKEKGREGVVPYLEIGNVDIGAKNYTLTEKPSVKGCRVAKKNDVLVSKVRPTRGAIVWIREDELEVSSAFTVLRNKGALAEKCLWQFLAWNRAYLNYLGENCTGTMYPTTSDEVISDFEMPLAPLLEQQRIVAKLEKLLGQVDACQQRLEKLPMLLKRFRQSILAAACSGRLTADWREQNPNTESAAVFVQRVQNERKAAYEMAFAEARKKGKRKPKPPKNEFTASVDDTAEGLPDNWCVARIIDISDCLDYIRVPINKTERLTRKGAIPYYGANGQVGSIDDFLFDEDLVLVVEDETFIGREIPFSYIIRGKSWVNNHAHVLRPLSGMPVEYLNTCLSYYDFTPLTSGTTGRRKLNQDALLNAPFWVAPLAEQQEIVRRVAGLFALADQLEQRLAQARKQVDKLTPSLLARAFAGKLVPQNPTDESAGKLLERIRNSVQRK